MNNPKDEKWLKGFGENLKSHRLKKELSLRKLADLAEIDHMQLHKIEKGETNPSISIIKMVSDALNVKIAKLFEFEVDIVLMFLFLKVNYRLPMQRKAQCLTNLLHLKLKQSIVPEIRLGLNTVLIVKLV